jgi:hypothetical protein
MLPGGFFSTNMMPEGCGQMFGFNGNTTGGMTGFGSPMQGFNFSQMPAMPFMNMRNVGMNGCGNMGMSGMGGNVGMPGMNGMGMPGCGDMNMSMPGMNGCGNMGMPSMGMPAMNSCSMSLGQGCGISDTETLCQGSYEIGNYVWLDADKDGIQDPDEQPLSDVVVELWADTDGDDEIDTKIGQAITDEKGEYYFGGKNDANMLTHCVSFVPGMGGGMGMPGMGGMNGTGMPGMNGCGNMGMPGMGGLNGFCFPV